MKPVRTFVECEHCGTLIETVSPPSERQYQQGLIELGEGSTVLLDVKDRPGRSVAHSAPLQGLYCDLECLLEKIRHERHRKGGTTVKLRGEPR